MIQPQDWTGAQTLEDYIFQLFREKRTESEEFQTLLRIYGREKMEKLWMKYQEKRNESPLVSHR